MNTLVIILLGLLIVAAAIPVIFLAIALGGAMALLKWIHDNV